MEAPTPAGGPALRTAVQEIAKGEPALKLREDAVTALFRGGDAASTEALVEIVAKEKDAGLRRKVARELISRAYPRVARAGGGGAAGDPRAMAAVIALAKTERKDSVLRKEAGQALYRGKDARTVRALIDILKGESPFESRTKLLRHLGGRAYPNSPSYRISTVVRGAGAVQRPDQAKGDTMVISAFVAMAKTEKRADLRREVIETMYRGEDDRTIAALIHVAKADPDKEIRKDVLKHLTKTRKSDPRVADALLEAIKESRN